MAAKLASLNDLLIEELKDLYSAENQLVKALPKMAKGANSAELRQGFEDHLEQTRKQVERLEEAAQMLDASLKGKKCKAMEGLIEEGKELLSEDADPAVLDAGLIAAAQKVEHYEIASYGTVCTWARELGLTDVADLLAETLEEEKATDEKLTELAEQGINREAEDADDEVMTNGKTAKRGSKSAKASSRSRR
jgi:ferritin-like metal-binding protein YciE